MRHRPPYWWPEGEAWPPRDPRRHWRRRRARFMGRVAFALSLIWSLSAIGAISVVSRVFGPRAAPGTRLWTIAAALLFAVSALAFLRVLRRVGSPAGDLVGAAHRIADGDFSVRVPEYGSPPVRAVASAFNDMASRLAAQEQQRRELMADIAHELRTPLSVVQGRLEGLIDGVYACDAGQLEPLLEETRVLARLVEDLRTLANAESGVLTLEREPTDVGMLVRDAASAVRDEAQRAGTAIACEDADAVTAAIDPVRMRQVLVNLIANAVRHGQTGRPGGVVRVDARLDAGWLVVHVVDNGPGIPADELAHVFDRFYKRRGSTGSGLGLTIARTLVRAHGGDIAVESRPGAGTTMTVRVPATSEDRR